MICVCGREVCAYCSKVRRRGELVEIESKRPKWSDVYEGCAWTDDGNAQALVTVTRHTLELAASALRDHMARDYYHNYGAAYEEINKALGGTQ